MVSKILSNCKKIPAYILYNIMGFVVYTVLVFIVNTVSGGDLFTLSGANQARGWNPSDVSAGKQAVLFFVLFLVNVCCFVSFFAAYYFMLAKREKHRDEYLRRLGTVKYDFAAERKRYFLEDALPEIIFFSVILLVVLIIDFFPLLLCFVSLTMFTAYFPWIVVLLLDVAGLLAFHWFVVPRLHTKWASERMRVDNE